MDAQIEAARGRELGEQRKLFVSCARHLFDNQVRDDVDERDDPSDNEAWLSALADWWGWDESTRDGAINDAAEQAMSLLRGEEPPRNPDDGRA